MRREKKKMVIQMIAEEDEVRVVNSVRVLSGFSSVSDYVRSLVTADVIARKKAAKYPGMYAMSESDWDYLSPEEKEEYMNKIGNVKPQSIDYFIERHKNGPSPMELLMKKAKEENELGL